MKTLLEYTENFETSMPVFTLSLSSGGERIQMSAPINRFLPQPIEGDHISELVCAQYSESFAVRDGEFKISKSGIASQAMQSIRKSMLLFLERNLQMRNPRQSKLYRWMYRDMPTTTEINTGLILLYKYVRQYADEDLKISSSNKDHLDNVVILLDAMRAKHEEQK